ncbi:MAG: ribonuclease HI [Patescibacteria group bacterium]
MKKDEIIIYTDGSSLGNPGPGGWGGVISCGEKIIEIGGKEKSSTNNRMEMTAAIQALRLIQDRKLKGKVINIHTDSSYLLNGITIWIYSWMKKNWRNASKDPVLNKDLWEELFKLEFDLKHKYEVKWTKVEGHSGVKLNERCDLLATGFAAGESILLFTGNLKEYERLF